MMFSENKLSAAAAGTISLNSLSDQYSLSTISGKPQYLERFLCIQTPLKQRKKSPSIESQFHS